MRNEEVRRHFISDVLGIPLKDIKSVRLENSFLSKRSQKEKQCILDVRMLLNDDRRINVELQIRRLAYWDKRGLYYLAKMYTDGLHSGQSYEQLKKCIVIDILDFPGDRHPGYHKIYRLRDEDGRLYSDQFEVHIIELNKELTGGRLDDWIRLLQIGSREELENMHSGNAGVARAIEEVRTMNLRRYLKARYELRLKNQRDQWALEQAIKEDAYKEGHERGLADGRAQGLAEGLADGRAEGLADGRAQGLADGRAQGHAEGHARGLVESSRRSIFDLLEEHSPIPDDIRARIYAEENMDILRKWLKAAAHATDIADFRDKIGQC